MSKREFSRRKLLINSAQGATAAALAGTVAGCMSPKTHAVDQACQDDSRKRGHQRLSIRQLQTWEALQYGMFIHFGLNTFLEQELPKQRVSASVFAPDRLDVDQWVSVARDAGMKYAVLSVKHVTGHCLWPSKHTDYSVANSGNRTDIMGEFVNSCQKRGVLPGFYYCSWDNGHRFGSKTHDRSEGYGVYVKPPVFTNLRNGMVVHPDKPEYLAAYTTSLYQDFVTAQMTELLTEYGPIVEVWIDIPGVLGQGYRKFLYDHITTLQPNTVVVANHGMNDGSEFREAYAWPCDGISIEQNLPPETGFQNWRTIKGRECYIAGECCATSSANWFHIPGEQPKPDKELAQLYHGCRARGVNLLLNIPPDKHGLIQDSYIQALARLSKSSPES